MEVLEPIWRHIHDNSPATQSRWQWTWVWNDSVFQKDGTQLQWVGRWWSGQHKRVVSGIDGLLLLVVVGDGRLVVPVDVAMRRPDPGGPGAPCWDKLTWARVMLYECLVALGRHGMALPALLGVADGWFGDSKLMRRVRDAHQGTLLVEGKAPYGFILADERQRKGQDLIEGQGWRWHQHPWEAGVRYVRLRATSPTYGQLTVISVLRLRGCVVLFYTSRVICKAQLTIEEISFSLEHYWRFADSAALELQGLSWGAEQHTV